MPDKLQNRIKQEFTDRSLKGREEELTEPQKRSKLVSLSLSEQELVQVKRKAATLHMSMSSFMRTAIFGYMAEQDQKRRM